MLNKILIFFIVFSLGFFSFSKIGQALNFDGVNDKTQHTTASTLNGLTTMTVSAWINPRTAGEGPNFGRIVRKANTGAPDGSNSYWDIHMSSNSYQFRAGYATTGVWDTPAGVIPFNQWTHIAVTYTHDNTSANPILYVNGQPVSVTESTAPVGATNSDNTTMAIGDWGSGTRAFDGLIDEVRVYNRALSASEIKSLYRGTHIRNGLVGYWPLWGGSLPFVPDLSGKKNHGSAVNMATFIPIKRPPIGRYRR